VLNARETRWFHTPARSAICEFEGPFEGETDFDQLGINLSVLEPGEPMSMYHWEADQEDFIVLSGEALLIVEGRSALCGAGTSCIALRGRSTRSSEPEPHPA
jgi:Uncharacterized conserved protein, contains double-stranded beta-helix domain